MEVLRPPLINIKGRIYRRNITKEEHYEEEDDFSYMETPGKLSQSESHTAVQIFIVKKKSHLQSFVYL